MQSVIEKAKSDVDALMQAKYKEAMNSQAK